MFQYLQGLDEEAEPSVRFKQRTSAKRKRERDEDEVEDVDSDSK